MPQSSSPPNKYDMSLRLWSDSVPFKQLADAFKTEIEALHVKGEPVAQDGTRAGRIAKRHYISLAHEVGHGSSDVISWLVQTSGQVQAQRELPGWLSRGQAEAIFWIAIFGRDEIMAPVIDPRLISRVCDLNASVLIENYTIPSDNMPVKTWYGKDVISHVAASAS